MALPVRPWLYLGAVLLFLGMVYFVVTGWDDLRGDRREFHLLAIAVCGISAVAYLAMALGIGVAESFRLGGRSIDLYWVRYVDWLFTAPLAVGALGLLVGASRRELAAMVGVAGALVLSGVLATLTGIGFVGPADAVHLVWWLTTAGLLLGLLALVFGPITGKARQLKLSARSTFTRLRNLLVVLWLAYPAWWLLGPQGGAVVGPGVAAAGFLALDLVAKVGVAHVLVADRAALVQSPGLETIVAE